MKPATVNDCDEDEKSSTYVVLMVEWCYKFSRSTAELRERPVAVIFASMGKRQTYKKLRFHPSLPSQLEGRGFPGCLSVLLCAVDFLAVRSDGEKVCSRKTAEVR